MIIGITGGIACGKSLVSNYLFKKNYVVVDADKIGHSILEYDFVKEEIKKEFGSFVFSDNNIIDRKKLSSVVFNDKKKLETLNKITHSKIKDIIRDKIGNNKGIIFLDIALLLEAKFTDLVDKIIVVTLDENLQLKRLMERNNFSFDEAKSRISSQMSNAEKIKFADFVIDNNGSIENTYKQVDEILKNIERK